MAIVKKNSSQEHPLERPPSFYILWFSTGDYRIIIDHNYHSYKTVYIIISITNYSFSFLGISTHYI